MTTKELDNFLMELYTVESMLKGSGETFRPQLSQDSNIASFQFQATEYCLESKGFLCSHYVDMESPAGRFIQTMKHHMEIYRSNNINRENKAMKWLYDSNIETLCQQISMLAMHAQFKDVGDIYNVSSDIQARSLNPTSVSNSLALYIYYTLLENTYIDILSYNELFVKSWYIYYENWNARCLMFRMNGNNWKNHFNSVLLE